MKGKKETVYFGLYVLLILGVYEYGIQRIYGFSILGDEFGYWANAAVLVGYDWSSCAQISAYYSYGYGLLLAIPLALCRTPLAAYRMAVGMNGLFLCGAFWFLQKILNGMFADSNHDRRLFSLLVAAFYPVSLYYMHMTLTETLLLFLYCSTCYLLQRFLKEGRKRELFLLMAVLSYMFFVHMRTVGTLMACGLVLILYGIRRKEYRGVLLAGGAVFVGCFLAGLFLKGVFNQAVYGTTEAVLQDVNDIGGQVERVSRILSGEGIWHLALSCMGKLFYIGMASFGTVYFAAAYCIRHIRETFSQFLGLSLLGQFGISAVFMTNSGRIDGLFYGRYNDFWIPVFIGIGLLFMFSCRHLLIKSAVCIVAHGCMAPLLLWYVEQRGLDDLKGYFAAGIGYTFTLTDGDRIDAFGPKLMEAYLVCTGLLVLLVACVCVARRFERLIWILSVFVCVEIFGAMVINHNYTYWFNDVNLECMDVITYLEEHKRPRIVYLDGGGFLFEDLVQFYLPEQEIEVVEFSAVEEDREDRDWGTGYVLVDHNYPYLEEMRTKAKPVAEGANLVLFTIETLK